VTAFVRSLSLSLSLCNSACFPANSSHAFLAWLPLLQILKRDFGVASADNYMLYAVFRALRHRAIQESGSHGPGAGPGTGPGAGPGAGPGVVSLDHSAPPLSASTDGGADRGFWAGSRSFNVEFGGHGDYMRALCDRIVECQVNIDRLWLPLSEQNT